MNFLPMQMNYIGPFLLKNMHRSTNINIKKLILKKY